jgi:hypothetical protein
MPFQTYITPHLNNNNNDDDDDCTNNWVVSKSRLHLNLAYVEQHYHMNQHKGQEDKNGLHNSIRR